LFLPSGGNEAVFAIPQDRERDIPVSFIGQNYGVRGDIVRFIEQQGTEVYKRGLGWPLGPVDQREMLEVYARSLITLGFGYIGKTGQLGLKGRDFEVPMTGCAYLTTWNPELAEYFEPDAEILFYRDREELVARLRSAIDQPEATLALGAAGRDRALREHTWTRRWQRLLAIVGGPAGDRNDG
jgi:hypothetical protein